MAGLAVLRQGWRHALQRAQTTATTATATATSGTRSLTVGVALAARHPLPGYEESVADRKAFWAKQAERLQWRRRWEEVVSHHGAGNFSWFEGGLLNVTESCIDRWQRSDPDRTALIWEKDEPGEAETISFQGLHDEVCRLANALKRKGVQKGDRVCLYLPMTPYAVYAMLACARIGAVHTVVFAGFSSEALAARINNAGCEVVITADEGLRGGKRIPLKATVDEALEHCPTVMAVLVQERTGASVNMTARDHSLTDAMSKERPFCPPVELDSEDPLFILYTSGSTGEPKGLVHTCGGYLTYASLTHETVFGYKPGDVYACVADVGWITGHTYVVYGPLANGATSVIFESIPTYPDAGRYWQMVEEHRINQFYTAPTAIRLLMKSGEELVTKYDRSSLSVLGSVGEPINPEAWRWYSNVVGEDRCTVVDTWWQTETGGIMITPVAGQQDTKPGCAMQPFYGVDAVLLGIEGDELTGNDQSGLLAIRGPTPGMARTIDGDHERYMQTYWAAYPGYYLTGDGARRDEDGHIWITGRVDDVINVSGHRLGTAEVESSLVSFEGVAEAAVVGFPHDIKGQGIYAYVTLKLECEETPELLQELRQAVRTDIGPFASPDVIQITPALPKTRSGKIMRRLLRKVAANEFDDLGDTSTLAEPEIVDDIIAKHKLLQADK